MSAQKKKGDWKIFKKINECEVKKKEKNEWKK